MRTSIKSRVLAVLGAMILPIAAMSDYTCTTNGYTFHYDLSGGNATINKNGVHSYDGTLIVPAYLDGHPVKALSSQAFQNMTNNPVMVFEEGLETLSGKSVFWLDGSGGDFLGSYVDDGYVVLPKTVKTFGADYGSYQFRGQRTSITYDGAPLNNAFAAVLGMYSAFWASGEQHAIGLAGVPENMVTDVRPYTETPKFLCRPAYYDAWANHCGADKFRGLVDDNYKYLDKAQVIFDSNYDGGGVVVKEYMQACPLGKMSEPTRLGYSFLGWYTKEYGEYGFPDGILMDKNDVVAGPILRLYAHWKAVEAPELTFEYDGGPFVGGKVTINGNLDGWTIYYTLDGSTPTTESFKYTGPFTLSSAANLKAYAVSAGGMETPVVGREYALVKRAGIENVKARQHYPWNGKVDIDFTLTGSTGAQYCVALAVEDITGGTNLPMQTVAGRRVPTSSQSREDEFALGGSSCIALSPGVYRFTWDADADLPDGFECEQVLAKATALGDGAFTYFVRFNANGGEGAMDDELFIYGVEKVLTANTFTREGYTFQGWATSADVSKAYDERQSVSNLTTSAGEVFNLYAVWEPKLYMVIDLSAGANASSYPISYLADVPSGGWSDEYKTTKLVLRRIEPGTFKMGGAYDVKLTKPFYIGIFECTQKQYEYVMGAAVGQVRGDRLPAEYVSYKTLRGSVNGAKWPTSTDVDDSSFFGRLRNRTGLDFDLLTEAQWEYACRAGTTSSFNNGGNAESDLNILGRYENNIEDGNGSFGFEKYTIVGSYLPNAWGIYDMHGNVWEWVLDHYGTLSSGTDPKGADDGKIVVRGGSWSRGASLCTSSYRNKMHNSYNFSDDGPRGSNDGNGFRIGLTLSK